MEAIWTLINEMSPYLLLGFLLAGLMHAFIPGTLYKRYLNGRGFKPVAYATLFGIPLPLCSCGVIPTAMSLRKNGASKGATTAFLISTPETGVDSIIATYSLLGLPFAIIRPLAALCNAMVGGLLVDIFGKKDDHDVNVDDDHDCCHEHECHCQDDDDDDCCCHKHECHCQDDDDDDDCCCHEHETVEAGCSCCHREKPTTFAGKLKEALYFGFVEMMGDIGKWLVVGLAVAGLITVLVPDSLFAIFRGNTPMSMLLVLCIALPMYICATGSIPIAVALMLKGLTPGAALVLLMAGPACNMASILVVRKVLGMRTLVIYLCSIIAMAILWGCIVDYLLPADWFVCRISEVSSTHEATVSMFELGCTLVLTFCLLRGLRR